jgi:hypothetical protein
MRHRLKSPIRQGSLPTSSKPPDISSSSSLATSLSFPSLDFDQTNKEVNFSDILNTSLLEDLDHHCKRDPEFLAVLPHSVKVRVMRIWAEEIKDYRFYDQLDKDIDTESLPELCSRGMRRQRRPMRRTLSADDIGRQLRYSQLIRQNGYMPLFSLEGHTLRRIAFRKGWDSFSSRLSKGSPRIRSRLAWLMNKEKVGCGDDPKRFTNGQFNPFAKATKHVKQNACRKFNRTEIKTAAIPKQGSESHLNGNTLQGFSELISCVQYTFV